MFEYIPYIFIAILLILFVIVVYIKIKYGFWAIQPVFHIYDLHFMMFPPGIINHELPEKNKYTNFDNIVTYKYDTLTKMKKDQILFFIKCNYLNNKSNFFNPKYENIYPHFIGHNYSCFISIYNEPVKIRDINNDNIINDNKIIGIMTTRPINIYINKNTHKMSFTSYYVDYLCVDKFHRKMGIAPQIIQTHHFNQSHSEQNICISLFKREEQLTGIVPLCFYYTYGFSAKTWHKPFNLDSKFKVININSQNFHLLFDFIINNNKQFEIVINTEVYNIIELVKTHNIHIYCVIENNSIVCCYFFRKSCTFVEKTLEVLTCFASINSTNNTVFIQGFKISFWEIAYKYNFGYSAIENISHNNIIIENLIQKTKPDIISPTAYFFYNFAYYTFEPQKVLIIN